MSGVGTLMKVLSRVGPAIKSGAVRGVGAVRRGASKGAALAKKKAFFAKGATKRGFAAAKVKAKRAGAHVVQNKKKYIAGTSAAAGAGYAVRRRYKKSK